MKFDGKRWTVCKTVVVLPREMWHGELKNYVTFGKICKPGTKGCVATNHVFYVWPNKFWPEPKPDFDEGTNPSWRVYAVPIASDKYSLTNMLYGPNGYAYLYLNGRVYVRKFGEK